MNSDAIAVEKAGESLDDEFGRKVRMNRVLLRHILPDVRILNIFRYRWFTYFYLWHRTARYLLWFNHILLLLTNALLAPGSVWFAMILAAQLLFLLVAGVHRIFKLKNKLTRMAAYYVITIAAQFVGVYRVVTGKAKPFWEKAESTR